MTYIASVIAREGVAIIADSLVTSMHRVIEEETLLDYLRSKSNNGGDVVLSPEELTSLFQRKPSHTKDYENKLFEYDKYTAITTSGMAWLDELKIEDIIKDAVDKCTKARGYSQQKIETKVKKLCIFLTTKVKEHIEKFGKVGSVSFILSHFDKKKKTPSVYRLTINPLSGDSLANPDTEYVTYKLAEDYEKVVCDGQNRISERILLGDMPTIYFLIPKLANKIISDFGVNNVPIDYINKLKTDYSIVPHDLFEGAKLFKLSELSLQQSVDLACLLMNIEIDFQKYTENIPTVGGVVKLAVIDRKGFRFISGDEITKPNILKQNDR